MSSSRMIVSVCAVLVFSAFLGWATRSDASNQVVSLQRPNLAVPWGDSALEISPSRDPAAGWRTVLGGSGPGVASGATHVVNQQCPDGGWGFPHDDCSATFNNITGPIALGLLQAYEITADPTHLASAVGGGDFDLTFQYGNGEDRFGAFAPAFLHTLTGVTGDATYSDHAAINFFDELTAGSYGPSDHDTAAWISALQAARSGSLINLRPWDLHNLPWVAGAIGNAGQQDAFRDAVLDGLNTLDNTDPSTVFYDMIGLTGGVRGLALNGTTSFTAISAPLFSEIDGLDTLCALADVLAGLQNANGSWYWSSGLATPMSDDEDTQSTAYAVLALLAAEAEGCGPYTTEIDLARAWLWSMQDTDGGFLSYPGGTHNTEVEGEVLSAMTPPDEVFVDDDYCAACPNDGHQWGYDAFDNIQDAINAVGNSTINVAPGTYVESGQIVIDQDVDIIGDDTSKPVIMTDQDTGTSGDARGWWLVEAGNTLGLENLVLDGSGFLIWQGIRAHGSGNVLNCDLRNMTRQAAGSPYQGTGIAWLSTAATWTITDTTFENMGRIGMHVFGIGIVENITYTGKGPGDHLDYAACIGGGGMATINNSYVSGCRGEASSDGSTSAGILATTFFGPGTTANLTNSTMTDNTTGIVAGFDSSDTSTVTANFNSIFGNDNGLINASATTVVDAENNWWGDATGPEDTVGSSEVDGPGDCNVDPADDLNADGAGNGVSDSNVDYCPWLIAPATLTLLVDDACNENGSGAPVTVTLRMTNAKDVVVGGQFFLAYDNSVLDFVSADPGDAPFTIQVFESVDEGAGTIDYAVGVPGGGPGTSADTDMAVFTFTALTEACSEVELVSFRAHAPPTQLTNDMGDPIAVQENNLDSVSIDGTDPVITCPTNVDIECDEVPEVGPSVVLSETGPTTGGVAIYYNSSGPEDLSNASYLRTVVDLSNLNGAEHIFDNTDLTGVPGVTWQSIFSGLPAGTTQFGLDIIRELDTDDDSVVIPTLTAVDNVDGTPGGATPAGDVAWAINDYKPNSPSGPVTPSNEPTNSLIRGPSPADPMIDIEIVELSLTGSTLTFSAKLNSDSTIYWFTPATPDSPMSNFGLDGELYVSGTLELASSAAGVDFYEGAMSIVANSPTATGFATATDNCTTFPDVTFVDDEDLTGCDGTGTITRTWTATDECGNTDTCDQIINVVDTTAPELTCPEDRTVECDESTDPLETGVTFDQGFEVDRDGWFDFNGTLTRVGTGTNGVPSAAGSWHAEVNGAFTRFGGYSSVFPTGGYKTRVDMYLDTGIGLPNDTRFDYSSAINNIDGNHRRDFIFNGGFYDDNDGPGAGLDRWIFSASNNAPGFPKNPSNSPIAITTTGWYTFEHHFYDSGGGVLAVDFNIYDSSGALVNTWTRSDATDIIGTTVGGNRYGWFIGPMPFDMPIDNTQLTGGAKATDNCDPAPEVTYSDVSAPGACADEQTITRTWMAEDDCGNISMCDQIINVVDTTAPMVSDCPDDIVANADAGGCTAELSWSAPTVSDNCDGSPSIAYDIDLDDDSSVDDTIAVTMYEFPDGTHRVTAVVTDNCGNINDSCDFTVTVNAVNELALDLNLQPTIDTGPITRCITLELFECPGTVPVEIVQLDLSFSAGMFSGQVEVPCGNYTCITARDELHTLRRTLDAGDGFAVSGTEYVADFATPGKDLLGGNLNDDFFIDILDFGVFVGQFGDVLGADTPCPPAGPHADISGNGSVFTEDFTFISANFLESHEPNCCGASGLVAAEGESPTPVTQISVRELRRRGLEDLIQADLNHDGWLDEADIAAFAGGARP